MTEPGFTSGPWEVVTENPPWPTYSGLVAMVAEYPYLHIVLGDGHALTRVPPKEWLANATLIASAPDLYEALSDIVRGEYYMSPAHEKAARAALVKATGNAPEAPSNDPAPKSTP